MAKKRRDDKNPEFRPGAWLAGTGPDSDIAICTRVRLARNLQGFPFSPRLDGDESERLYQFVVERLGRPGLPVQLQVVDLSPVDELERSMLVERHLISRELASCKRPSGVAVDDDENVAIMINEEDHLRAQVFAPGLATEAVWRRAERLDDALMQRLPMAWSEEFGFLTACPTNTGTGLRLSVMMHLPGLVWSEEIDKATNVAQKIHLAVRGLYGEGSRAAGDFYQISNQVTLGRTESQLIDDLRALVPVIVGFERTVRDALFADQRTALADRVARSHGLLRTARSMATDGALAHLSNLRLGMHLGLFDQGDLEVLNLLRVQVQQGHVQALNQDPLRQEPLEASTRDQLRAGFLRRQLAR